MNNKGNRVNHIIKVDVSIISEIIAVFCVSLLETITCFILDWVIFRRVRKALWKTKATHCNLLREKQN